MSEAVVSAHVRAVVESGLRWLYNVRQPPAALVADQGLGLPVIEGRRYVFIPDVDGRPLIAVHAVRGQDSGSGSAISAQELTELVSLVEEVAGGGAAVLGTPNAAAARIRLDAPAHPSLVAAAVRFRAGCPIHHSPACRHVRSADHDCQWFPRGFARLTRPAPPVVRRANPFDEYNRRRSERAAKTAAEALTVLSQRPSTVITVAAMRVLELRASRPHRSLAQLARLHTPPLSEDVFASRLRRAVAMAANENWDTECAVLDFSAASRQRLENANAARQLRGAQRGVASAREALKVLVQQRIDPETTEAVAILRLRIDHPELSLSELAQIHEPPLTKDCYAGRLRRAIAAAKERRSAHSQQLLQYTGSGV